MADFPAVQLDAMVDQLSGGVGRHVIAGHQGGTAQWQEEVGRDLDGTTPTMGAWARGAPVPLTSQNFGAVPLEVGPEDDFFGHVYVLPRSIDAGIVIATKVFTLTVYNSHRDEQRSLDSFVNGAGQGVTITDLPTLPETIEEQDGFDLTLQVSPDGPPFISGDLQFGFDTRTVLVPVSGQRTIVFPHEPEQPATEVLIFATDIRPGRAGKEQRASLRHVPRARWELRIRAEGKERRSIASNLFDSQARAFGVPIWWEPSFLSSAASATDLAIQVDSTDLGSFVAGGLAILFRAHDDFEALQVDSLTSTSITFQTPLTKSFAAGTRVLPMRIGFMRSGTARTFRFPLNVEDVAVEFTTIDNEVDLADTSAFSSFGGKVLLDDDNFIRGRTSEDWRRRVRVVDSRTGTFEVFTEWPTSRRGSTKGFHTLTRQQLWDVRRLLHALRGRQVSFWLPTFFPDLLATGSVGSGSSVLTVENVGYAKFVQSRQPRNVVRLRKTDGTEVIRTVTNASEIDDDEEQITVDSPWGIDALPSEVERIDFVEKVRLDSDEIRITHKDALGRAEIIAPVRAVLD